MAKYIDNNKFIKDIKQYLADKKEAENKGEQLRNDPSLDVLNPILQIIDELLASYEFSGYCEEIKEEMQGTAIEKCIKVARRYDELLVKAIAKHNAKQLELKPKDRKEFVENPFALFSQTIKNCFYTAKSKHNDMMNCIQSHILNNDDCILPEGIDDNHRCELVGNYIRTMDSHDDLYEKNFTRKVRKPRASTKEIAERKRLGFTKDKWIEMWNFYHNPLHAPRKIDINTIPQMLKDIKPL